MQRISQSLAGRVRLTSLLPFSLGELTRRDAPAMGGDRQPGRQFDTRICGEYRCGRSNRAPDLRPAAMATQPAGRGRRWLQKAELILAHLAAVAMGFVLMVVGLGLGVTMIMLPVGLVVGLLGVMLFLWGLLGHLGNGR